MKFFIKNIIFLVLISFSLASCKKQFYNATSLTWQEVTDTTAANWMKHLNNQLLLSNISLPGTHNSAALHETIANTAQCQVATITQQLQAGVRFLDIRCRQVGDSFEIYHGSVNQNLSFTQVLQQCCLFLQQHRTETVVMSIKPEHTAVNATQSFYEVFNAYLKNYASYFYTNNTMPILKNVQGKIVLLRRFYSPTTMGINANNGWKDNDVSTINNQANMAIQDMYKVVDHSDKWYKIEKYIQLAAADNNNTLYLNFCSGYQPIMGGIPNITRIASYINPQLQQYLNQLPKQKTGILICDYITPALIQSIYSRNF